MSDIFLVNMIKYSKPKSKQRKEWVKGIISLHNKESRFMTNEQLEVLAEATEYLERVKLSTHGDVLKLGEYLDDMERKVKGGGSK